MVKYRQKSEKNKDIIVRRDVKNFKKYCLKEFKNNVKYGMAEATIDFFPHIDGNFEEEISEIVLRELQEEHKNIEFSFSHRHYKNSYKGINMVAK